MLFKLKQTHEKLVLIKKDILENNVNEVNQINKCFVCKKVGEREVY